MSQSVGSDGNVTQSGGVNRVGADGNVENVDQTGQQVGAEAKPPEGFASWEEAYKALSEKQKPAESQQQQQQQPPKQEEQQQQQQEQADPRFEPFTKEFTEKGTLSEESIKKAMETFSVPRAVVEQYLRGAAEASASNEIVALKAEKAAQPFFTEVGDEAKYGEFREWSAENMTEAEIAGFDALLQQAEASGDAGPALSYLKPFIGKWKAGGNAEGRDITRNNPPSGSTSGVQPYASMAEQKKDQASEQYDRDPAFRKQVEARIAISKY